MWTLKNFSELLGSSQQTNNSYLPPHKKAKDSLENSFLKEALESCKSHEMGIEEASLIYGIPKRTLRAKLKDSNSSVIDENYKVFVLSAYPEEIESELISYLQDCFFSLITMSTIDIRRLAYELVCKKYKMISLPTEKNCILGQKWYNTFITKYQHLDIKKQNSVSYEETSINFYNTLENFIFKNKLELSQIYCVDGIEVKFHASCVEDMKVFHQNRTMYETSKALCCINPLGDFVPPLFLNLQCDNKNLNVQQIAENKLHLPETGVVKYLYSNKNWHEPKLKYNFKIKNIMNSLDLQDLERQIKMHINKKHQPMSEQNEEELREKLYEQFAEFQNKILFKSENMNEINTEMFYTWFINFLNHVKSNTPEKLLLLISNQNYIKSLKILELAKKNNVLFLVLPPHSYHKIYPLDGFSMSLNRNLSTCARRWLGNNPNFKAQEIPLQMLFMEAFHQTKNSLIAKNGFLYSGIWPVNRNIFESCELGGESILSLNKSKINNDGSILTSSSDKRNNLFLAGITNEVDLVKICRVCMKEKMYMKPLVERESLTLNFNGRKLSKIKNLSVSPGDGLPSFICQYCLVQLMDTIKIKELTIESHKKQLKLREALNKLYFEDGRRDSHDLLNIFQNQTLEINKFYCVISKNFDVSTICRICMEEKPLMTSIFFKAQCGTILCSDTYDKITKISDCQVHAHDGLSGVICPFCRAAINKAFEFTQRVISSDKILRDIVAYFRTEN